MKAPARTSTPMRSQPLIRWNTGSAVMAARKTRTFRQRSISTWGLLVGGKTSGSSEQTAAAEAPSSDSLPEEDMPGWHGRRRSAVGRQTVAVGATVVERTVAVGVTAGASAPKARW